MRFGLRSERAAPVAAVCALACALIFAVAPAHAALDFEAAAIVQAAGTDLVVGGYAVPSLVDWNGDELPDLLVGEGGGAVATGKVRVYLNLGSPGSPAFGAFSYAQAGGVDLAWPASGCLGLFPRAVQWDGDGRKDLVVGLADGRVRLYTNVATDAAPAFDAGVFLLRSGLEIDVGNRAAPLIADWDGDGRKDLIVGALDGRVRVYLNSGADAAPLFVTEMVVQSSGADLLAPSGRSSPCLADLDGDGRRDLLAGNTDGQLLLYRNFGADAAPAFAGYEAVTAAGAAIDLDGTPRSRPCLCGWNADTAPDALVGSGDGRVRLYLGHAPTSAPAAPPAPRPAIAACPNPFNPMTTLRFDLPRDGRATLVVYDLRGAPVRALVDAVLPRGSHLADWDGRDDRGRDAPSGIYLARLVAGSAVRTARLCLAR
jgi:hypothetical protein